MPKLVYSKCMTTGDLIKELSKYPSDMKIGRSGHFGEFIEMSPNAIVLLKTSRWLAQSQHMGNLNDNTKTVQHIELEYIDIGDDPC